MNLKDGNARFLSIIIAALCIFSAYLFVLFKMQVIDNEYYREQSESKIYSTESISASRGNICDRNGQLLVTNETVYTIRFSRSLMPTDKQDSIILSLCKLLDSAGESYFDSLPISDSAPYSFVYEDETSEKQIQALIERFKLNEDATAAQVMEQLIKKYKINTSLTTQEKRIIAGVRYEMERSSFSASNPYTFANDISINTVTAIKELSDEYPGVDIGTESKRVYTTPYLASHILGRTGKIYAEEYPELRDKGYKMNEYVGKEGIEKAMEDYLRGTDGVRVIERDSDGKVLNVTTVRDGEIEGKGHTCYFASDDDGYTFFDTNNLINHPFNEMTHGLQETGIVQFESGKIFSFSRTANGSQFESFSEDDGMTWSVPMPSTVFFSPASPMHIRHMAGRYTAAVFNPIPNYPHKEYKELSWGRTPLVCLIAEGDGSSFWDGKAENFILEDDPRNGYCYPVVFDGGNYFLAAYYHSNNSGTCLNSCKIVKIPLELIDEQFGLKQ